MKVKMYYSGKLAQKSFNEFVQNNDIEVIKVESTITPTRERLAVAVYYEEVSAGKKYEMKIHGPCRNAKVPQGKINDWISKAKNVYSDIAAANDYFCWVGIIES